MSTIKYQPFGKNGPTYKIGTIGMEHTAGSLSSYLYGIFRDTYDKSKIPAALLAGVADPSAKGRIMSHIRFVGGTELGRGQETYR